MIQDFPEIATSLKSFCIDGRFDVICSGSMLGINYKKIQSNSVGYKSEFSMQSLDFEEFLWAKGYGDETVEDLLLCQDMPWNFFALYEIIKKMPEDKKGSFFDFAFEEAFRDKSKFEYFTAGQ